MLDDQITATYEALDEVSARMHKIKAEYEQLQSEYARLDYEARQLRRAKKAKELYLDTLKEIPERFHG